MFAPQVGADALREEPPEGAEGAAAVLEVEVAGPSAHDLIDRRDHLRRGAGKARARRQRPHAVPESLARRRRTTGRWILIVLFLARSCARGDVADLRAGSRRPTVRPPTAAPGSLAPVEGDVAHLSNFQSCNGGAGQVRQATLAQKELDR